MDSLRSLVECPVCFDVPREARVYICVNGHSICGQCKDQINICPQGQCAYGIPPTRNRMVESILESGSIVINCTNRESGCTFEGLWKDIDKHEEEDCMHRSVQCPVEGCTVGIKAMDLFEHLELECQFSIVECSNSGCNERMTAYMQTTHASACGFRMVSCPNAPGCDVIMRASHKHIHLQYECMGRMLKCDNQGCQFQMCSSEHSEYLDLKYIHRSTQHRVPNAPSEMSAHSLVCPFRTVSCSFQGCPTNARADTIKDHEAECQLRLVTCPQSTCNKKMSFRSIGSHIRSHKDFIGTERSLGEALSQRLPFPRGWELHSDFGWVPLQVDVGEKVFFCNAYRNQGGLHLWASMLGSPSEAEQYRCQLNVVGNNGDGIEFKTKVFSINVERDSAISHKDCLLVGLRTLKQMLVGDARKEQVIKINLTIYQASLCALQ